MSNLKIIPIHYPLDCSDFKGSQLELKVLILNSLKNRSINTNELFKQFRSSTVIHELIREGLIELSFTLHGPLRDQKRHFYQITHKGLDELKKIELQW
ncbi:MAG: hypothetical protein ACPGLV_10680 [Bacteroidia bacterium]